MVETFPPLHPRLSHKRPVDAATSPFSACSVLLSCLWTGFLQWISITFRLKPVHYGDQYSPLHSLDPASHSAVARSNRLWRTCGVLVWTGRRWHFGSERAPRRSINVVVLLVLFLPGLFFPPQTLSVHALDIHRLAGFVL